MNWIQPKHQTPPRVIKAQPYASLDDGGDDDDPWNHLVFTHEEDTGKDPLGLAENVSFGEEVIFKKLRPSSSTHSTYMNSHDVRTPPQINEEAPAYTGW